MKKCFIIAAVFVLVCVSAHCQASDSDTLWQARIDHLETTYGEKFSPVNNMRLFFKTSVPVTRLGESCRMVDLSTKQNMKNWRASVGKMRKEILGGKKAKGGHLIKLPWYFWPYKKFVRKYEKEIKAYLPEGARNVVKDLLKACALYDYCKKQKNNENIMFIFPAECVLGIKVPAGPYETKQHYLYMFLLSEESVAKIHKAS